MQTLQEASSRHNHIRSVFRAGAALFDRPRLATFEELADRLCRLGERYECPLTSLEVDPSDPGQNVRRILLRQLAAIEPRPR